MTLTNFEEYDDPILYDKENEAYLSELPFLLNWASKTEGPIIDLACGTGRLTIPLAKNGYPLIGVDIHKGMLKEAQKKSSNLDVEIEWVEQDCTKLHLPLKSNLIYSVGNSFQHFFTNEEQDGFLNSVNKHLEIGGVFIFGTRFPSVEELLQPSTEEYWKTYTDNETRNIVDVYTKSHYDSLKQVQHYTTIRRYKTSDGQVVGDKRTNISLRYVFPKEMERILLVNGFEIVNVYKDWNETPVTNDSYEMIYVCKKITKSIGNLNRSY
ncbi:class I SAM-dependent methyltransferase [Sporosarcina gallistercoris]|uniref:Methyltransferase domain-containing protein n=1 Tax=Sporosarcina gallistercoris TaxID=2762245 RepID=A0ABR8PJ06_9BACL|nr:class I SAM-dependent methyltransferase [Sporosarcina gallistercoris]MBD7908064.1 methyltransferase domain-containing protein [Sporosarcina gallistercoris]